NNSEIDDDVIVPDGLRKNYPKNIEFDQLPNRINKLFPQLFEIVTKKTKSTYRDLAMEVYNE
ncbi:15442_t:CDS:2, partial [Racocetra fulgida]